MVGTGCSQNVMTVQGMCKIGFSQVGESENFENDGEEEWGGEEGGESESSLLAWAEFVPDPDAPIWSDESDYNDEVVLEPWQINMIAGTDAGANGDLESEGNNSKSPCQPPSVVPLIPS